MWDVRSLRSLGDGYKIEIQLRYDGNTVEIHGQQKVREIRCAKFVIRDNFNGSLRKQHMQPLKLLQPMKHKTGETILQ
ncbi:MAG: hypothetical protein A2Z72_05635 [Omnitrophica bacterium RBG_13_46_9]|nr:MAG: hypothetical protein A2Z72_05635 [Omnitrophica bacterium RBG_13_46_9]